MSLIPEKISLKSHTIPSIMMVVSVCAAVFGFIASLATMADVSRGFNVFAVIMLIGIIMAGHSLHYLRKDK